MVHAQTIAGQIKIETQVMKSIVNLKPKRTYCATLAAVIVWCGVTICFHDELNAEDQQELALQCLDLAAAELVTKHHYQVSGWDIAKMYLILGEPKKAWDINENAAQAVVHHEDRVKLQRLSVLLDDSGQFPPQPWEADWNTTTIFASYAITLTKQGDLQAANTWVDKIENLNYRHIVVCRIARELNRQGRTEEALDTLAHAMSILQTPISSELLTAAIELGYQPLIKELFTRMRAAEHSSLVAWNRPLIKLALNGQMDLAADLRILTREQIKQGLVLSLCSRVEPPLTDEVLQSFDVKMSDIANQRLVSPALHLLIAANNLERAENLAGLPRNRRDRIFLLSEVGIAYSARGDVSDAKRVLSELRKEIDVVIGTSGDPSKLIKHDQFAIRGLITAGILASRCGNTARAREWIETAEAGLDVTLQEPQARLMHPLLLLATTYQKFERHADAWRLFNRLIAAKSVPERDIAESFFLTLIKPTILHTVEQDGDQEALRALQNLKSRTPRVRYIELVAECKILIDGPNAEIPYASSRKQDVNLSAVYTRAAKHWLQDELAKVEQLQQEIPTVVNLFKF